jgi:hypothetical protein
LPTTIAASDLLLPGYRVDESTGAWCTLPWPKDQDEKDRICNSSLGAQIIEWAEGRAGMPGLVDHVNGGPLRFTDGQIRFIML